MPSRRWNRPVAVIRIPSDAAVERVAYIMTTFDVKNLEISDKTACSRECQLAKLYAFPN